MRPHPTIGKCAHNLDKKPRGYQANESSRQCFSLSSRNVLLGLTTALELPPEKGTSVSVRLGIKKGGSKMVRRLFTPEQIINKLREAEVLLSQGCTVGDIGRKIGVTEQTYYRWRREYGGMPIAQVKRLKALEKENGQLRKLVADLSLDNAILKEAARGN